MVIAMKRKIIAALLAAAMLAQISAQAEEWIEISSWSYNEVSGFVSDGLMPEMIKGKGNYKQPITRGEFAELIYSVMDKTGIIMRAVNLEPFYDCDGYTGAQMLGSLDIANGVTELDEHKKVYFAPEENITREDAAVLLSRAVQISFNSGSRYADYDFSKIQERYDDITELSDYAINPIRYMFQYKIMEGDDENRRFAPKGNLSIEQAVLMVYRYYKAIPRVIESDNEDVTEGEVIKQFDGGITEVYENNTYYIKDESGEELMSFEADVYSSLMCCEFKGERLCFAVNFNDNTDVYNIDTQDCKYTIPNIVYELDAKKGYAYTYSGRFMPVYSGMWNMNGYLAIPPSYSRSEVDELIASAEEKGIEVYAEPTPEPDAEPDGMIYYSDTHNGGKLCSIDSNGQHKKVLVDEECKRIMYINGVLYFAVINDGLPQFYCMDPEGGMKHWLSEIGVTFCVPLPLAFYEESSRKDLSEQYRELNKTGAARAFFSGQANYGALNDGALLCGKIYEDDDRWGLYEARLTENGVEKIPISDFVVNFEQITAPYDGSGRIFFTEADKMSDTGSSPLYMYDGTGTRVVSGNYNVISYGFMKNSDGTTIKDRIYFTAEELEGKCAYVDLTKDEIVIYTPTGKPQELPDATPQYTPDNYYIAYNKNGLEVDTREAQNYNIRVKYNGGTTEIQRADFKMVIGDYIYYVEESRLMGAAGTHYISFGVRKTGSTPLCAYNYKTGETIVVAEDYYTDSVGGSTSYVNRSRIDRIGSLSSGDHDESDIYIYCSNSGEYKQVRGDHAVTVYPNKGMHKTGSVYAIGEITESSWDPGCVYKVDEDGRICRITDGQADYWVYVPNGAAMPQFAYRSYMQWAM